MPIRDIAEWLIGNQGFQSRYLPLIIDSVSSQFGSRFIRELEHQNINIDWRYLLMCASILAISEKENCQEAALRIAQHAVTISDMP